MASTFINDLRLEEMATGENAGSWGTKTNTNLELIAEAFSFSTEGITTNADSHTTTIADGATDPGRSMLVLLLMQLKYMMAQYLIQSSDI